MDKQKNQPSQKDDPPKSKRKPKQKPPEDEPPFTEADFLDALKKVARKVPEKKDR